MDLLKWKSKSSQESLLIGRIGRISHVVGVVLEECRRNLGQAEALLVLHRQTDDGHSVEDDRSDLKHILNQFHPGRITIKRPNLIIGLADLIFQGWIADGIGFGRVGCRRRHRR